MNEIQPEIHVGTIGLEFRSQILDENMEPLNVNGASSIKFLFKRPNGTPMTKVGSAGSLQQPLYTGAEGWVRYTTLNADLDVAGNWEYQVKVVFADGRWYTNREKFFVHGNLVEEP